jgi:uncharacterized protein YdhG (YjbR/CyaY superfamily)
VIFLPRPAIILQEGFALMTQPKTIEEYINSAPPAAREKLETITKLVREVAPQAQAKLSYGMPYFNLNGRLLYYAAFKDHIGLYPLKSGVAAFQKELNEYKTTPGTIQFPLNKPLPLELIRKIVAFRVQENLSKPKK